MKRTTSYSLLCVTILASGISLAADNDGVLTPLSKIKLQEDNGTLTTPVSKLKKEISEISQTPDISEMNERYRNVHSPETARFVLDMDISRENAIKREELQHEAKCLEFQKKLKILEEEKEEEKKKYDVCLKKIRQELAASEKKPKNLVKQ